MAYLRILFVCLKLIQITAGNTIPCNEYVCSPEIVKYNQRSNGVCDLKCMHAACHFDSIYGTNLATDKKESECLLNCLASNSACTYEILGNGDCDEGDYNIACNSQVCGWDFGDCGYCAPGCKEGFLDIKVSMCFDECRTESCYYQNEVCVISTQGSWCSEGCTQEKLENETCEQECYNIECNYDNNQCDKICYEWMLGNGICEDQCNGAEFNYDEGDCLCAPGCLPGMEINSSCEPECYTKNCKYDTLFKCNRLLKPCALGCVYNHEYEYCNYECLTWKCGYHDNGRCDWRIKTHAFYTQMILRNKDIQVNIYQTCLRDEFKDMLDGKTPYCTLAKLGDGICHIECNTLDCAYDLGDCSKNCDSRCDLCYSERDHRKCLKCKPGKVLLYTACFDDCPYGFVANQDNLCVRKYESDKLLVDNFFVIQEGNELHQEQKGDSNSPFTSISDAFAHIRCALVMINLLNYDGSEHLLKPVNRERFPAAEILYSDDRPLDFDGLIEISSIEIYPKICSDDFKTRCYTGNAKLRWSGLKPIQLDTSTRLFINNIDLYGYNSITIEPCPLNEYFEYCTYCQNIEFDYEKSIYKDDHDTEITWKYAGETDCQRYKDSVLIQVHPTGYLSISNSKIYEWRAGFSSIISVNRGIVELYSVQFENIILSSQRTSAVIISEECNDNSYRCGEISIKDSTVSLLNNGFEYNPNKSYSGFLYAKGLYKLTIENSNFNYNLVYKGYNSYDDYPGLGTLIHMNNFLIVKISDTRFDSNLTDDILYFNMNTIYEIGYDDNVQDYHPNISHITLQNLTFINNHGSLVKIIVKNELPNIDIYNIYSKDNFSTSEMIFITSNTYRPNYQYDTIKTVYNDNKMTEHILKKRSASLSDIFIIQSYSVRSLILCESLGNFEFKKIHIEKSVENPIEDYSYMDSLVYHRFRENSQSYISNQFLYSDFKYQDVIRNSCYFNKIRGLTLQNIILIENHSRRSSVSIDVIDSFFTSSISDIKIFNNSAYGESATSGLSIVNLYNNLTIFDVLAESNTNSNSNSFGVIYISAKSSCEECRVEIKDSIFQSNLGGFNGAISAYVPQLYINNVTFSRNYLSSGFGGGVYYCSVGDDSYSIEIINSLFSENEVLYGKGAAIAIDSRFNTNKTLNLSISNSDFRSNISAKDASTIYISTSVKIDQESKVKDCRFMNNISEGKGNIYLEFYNGCLTFENCLFTGNEAKYGIVIYSDIYFKPSIIQINSCTFQHNLAIINFIGSVIHMLNKDIQATLESYSCIFKDNQATIVYLDYVKWLDTGSTFQNNTSYHAPVMILKNSAEASLISAIIQDNSSSNSAGAIELSSSGKLKISNSTLKNNRSASDGGVILMDQNSIVGIKDSTLLYNYAEGKGSVIFSTGCRTTASYILNSQIFSNESKKGGCIYLLNSYLNITSSEIFENKASENSPGIIMNLSTLDMSSSTIRNQAGSTGAAIYVMPDSKVNINASIFKFLMSYNSGGSLYVFESDVEISNTVIQNTSAYYGGAVYVNSNSKLLVLNTHFLDSTSREKGAIIMAQDSEVLLLGCTFDKFVKTAIEGTNIKSLEVVSSVFMNGVGELGGAILCQDCERISIASTIFRGNSALIGGAIYAESRKESSLRTKYEVIFCEFVENRAEIGGAIFLDNMSINVTHSYFSKNSAHSGAFRLHESGKGGAIHLQCSNIEECSFIIDNNTFQNNQADSSGGAISWRHFAPSNRNNKYINNTAFHGDNLATYPKSLLLGNQSMFLNFKSDIMLIQKLGMLEGVAPGQPGTEINISLIDAYDNIVATDSTSIGELTSQNPEVVLSGLNKIVAQNGVFNFKDYIILSRPGTIVNIFFYTNALDLSNFKSLDEIVTLGGLIAINLRNCTLGETTTYDKCIKCPEKTYSLDPIDNECRECPTNAICYGEFYIVPKQGYWRTDMFSDNFMRCPREKSCIGSPRYPDISFVGECEKGYEGNLCQGCSQGYWKFSKNSCGECPENSYNTLKLVFSIFGVIIVIVIITRSNMRSVYKNKTTQSIYLKIFINHIQLVSIVAGFELEWPELMKDFMSVQENSGNISYLVLSIDCLLYDYGYASDRESLFFIKLVLMLFLPFALILLSFLFWSWIAIYYQKASYLKQELVATIIILIFLMHPSIVNSMFYALNCVEIEGEYWLMNDMNIRCWSNNHRFYAEYIVVPTIIFWGITIPSIGMMFLIKYRRKLHEISIRSKLGFLYNGYTSKYFYWEYLVLYRKLLVISLAVFLSKVSVSIQALTVISILIYGLYYQSKHNPYEIASMNEMELRSILVAVITIYSGLFYISGDMSEEGKLVFFCMILLVNGYFISFWVKALFSSIKHLIAKIRNKKRNIIDTDLPELQEQDSDLSFRYTSRRTRYSSKSTNSVPYNIPNPIQSLSEEIHSLGSIISIKDLYLTISRRKNLEARMLKLLSESVDRVETNY